MEGNKKEERKGLNRGEVEWRIDYLNTVSSHPNNILLGRDTTKTNYIYVVEGVMCAIQKLLHKEEK